MRRSTLDAGASRFVKLRPDFVAACDGNACAALLLDVFDFRAAQDDNGFTENPWSRASLPWLSGWLGGAFGERALRSALTLLEERGFIESRTDPDRLLDRTKQYRLRPAAVRACIAAFAGMEDDERSPHARVSDDVEEPQQQETRASNEPSAIDEVWAYYQRVIAGAERQTLNDVRRRIIRNALKLRSLEEVKAAIFGLSLSRYHNGENEQQIKYLDIRYALKGNARNGESDEGRIDKMAAVAGPSARQPNSGHKLPAGVEDGLRKLRDYGEWDERNKTWVVTDHRQAQQLGEHALTWLAEHDLMVVWAGENHRRIEIVEVKS